MLDKSFLRGGGGGYENRDEPRWEERWKEEEEAEEEEEKNEFTMIYREDIVR